MRVTCLAPLLASAGILFGCSAESLGCRPYGCSGVEVDDDPVSPWHPAPYEPDERPVYVIQAFHGMTCGGGSYAPCDPHGRSAWWVDGPETTGDSYAVYSDDGRIPSFCCEGVSGGWHDAGRAGDGVPDRLEELIFRLNEAYENGYRRIVLNRPAGQEPPPAGSFWTLEAETRSYLWRVKEWITNRPDVDVGLYAGFQLYDPCVRPDPPGTGTWIPITNNADDMCHVYQNVRPWADHGLTQIWMDASSKPNRREQLWSLAGSPNYTGVIRISGEAVPNTGVYPNDPIIWMVQDVPWLAHTDFLRPRVAPAAPPRSGPVGPFPQWNLSSIEPREVGVGLDPVATDNCRIVSRYVAWGYIPWGWTKEAAQELAACCEGDVLDGPCTTTVPPCVPLAPTPDGCCVPGATGEYACPP